MYIDEHFNSKLFPIFSFIKKSFFPEIAGPYFGSLQAHIGEVFNIDQFVDVSNKINMFS